MDKDDSLLIKKKPRSARGKWLFLFVSSIALFILVCWGLLVYIAQDSALPLVKYQGQDLSLKSFSEVTKAVLKSDKKIKKQQVALALDGKEQVKTLDELGFSVQSSKTADAIFNFGKQNYYIPLPDMAYFNAILNADTEIPVSIKYSSQTEKKLSDLFPQSQKDAVDPSIAVADGQLVIVPESNGSKIDVNDLLKKIQGQLNSELPGKISLAKTTTLSNFTVDHVNVFKQDINDFVSKSFYLQSDYKKLKLKPENLVNFIDLERTILSQKLTLSDQGITDYLNSNAAKSFNIKAKKREISNVDNSIITEGAEGKQLDAAKSLDNVRNALAENQKSALIAVSTSPIEEEYVSPGYNPGKYPGRFVEVNLSDQMLYTFDGTQLIGSYRVSTGKWSMPTPEGEYSINNKVARAYSQEYDLYMPYWMAFIGSKYGLHELPEWADGTKEGEGHLGTPVSHGCVRLGRGAAQEVYDFVDYGTPVYIHR